MTEAEILKSNFENKVKSRIGDIINQEKAEHEVNEPEPISMKFQIMATGLVICCAITGGILGIIMSNSNASEDLVSWFALPGDLFIRALKCAVLPLVFVNVIIAVIQMAEAGKAGAVGKYTLFLYFLTTFLASVEGLIVVLLFQSKFSSKETEEDSKFIQILCPLAGTVLIQDENEVFCVPKENITGNDADFIIETQSDFFITRESEFESITFSETLQDSIFKQLVPENIVEEFANGGFVSVVMFAIVFGAASARLSNAPELLLKFLQDVNDILTTIISWVILFTPFAVFSLIAGALASQNDLAATFGDIGILVGSATCGLFMHVFIVYPALFFMITRENPYKYMRFLVPAQIFAFSCASSAATLPVTMNCVKATRLVPDSIRDFVLPIGSTVNMDGTALYFPSALIFLATTAGISSGPAEYFLIVLVSTIGSAGAAPVPNAGLVLIITAFNTVYGATGTPENFALIVAIDWLMDRLQTPLNVTGDAMVCRMVAFLVGAHVEDGKPTSQMAVSQME